MVAFAGVSHVAFTVSDLTVSQRFYTSVLDFVAVLDVGYGRICIHRGTGFTIALLHHEGTTGDRFSPLRTGLDHLGLAVATRAELVQWEQRLQAAGVPYSPIQDMPLGHHLNFTDPDGIALELQAPNELYAAALVELRESALSDDDVRARAAQLLQAPGVVQG